MTAAGKSRIALISPYGHLSISLSVVNSAKVWESCGFGVDIYVPETPGWEPPDFGGADVTVLLVPIGRGSARSRHVYAIWTAVTARGRRYAHVIGFDVGGLSAAALVAMRSRCSYTYHSLELWTKKEVQGLKDRFDKAIERLLARRARLVVAQDAARLEVLSEDLGFAMRQAIVPNAPLGLRSEPASTYLRDKFGIPDRSRIVLQSGSLIPQHCCVEVIDSVDSWPADYVLVVHGWAPTEEYRNAVQEAAARSIGIVHLAFEVLPLEMVDSLYASADVGLALYESHEANFDLIGNAAGKVFNFMRAGVPMIVSDLPGLSDLVRESGCGVAVESPQRLGAALRELSDDMPNAACRVSEAFRQFEFGHNYRQEVLEPILADMHQDCGEDLGGRRL